MSLRAPPPGFCRCFLSAVRCPLCAVRCPAVFCPLSAVAPRCVRSAVQGRRPPATPLSGHLAAKMGRLLGWACDGGRAVAEVSAERRSRGHALEAGGSVSSTVLAEALRPRIRCAHANVDGAAWGSNEPARDSRAAGSPGALRRDSRTARNPGSLGAPPRGGAGGLRGGACPASRGHAAIRLSGCLARRSGDAPVACDARATGRRPEPPTLPSGVRASALGGDEGTRRRDAEGVRASGGAGGARRRGGGPLGRAARYHREGATRDGPSGRGARLTASRGARARQRLRQALEEAKQRYNAAYLQLRLLWPQQRTLVESFFPTLRERRGGSTPAGEDAVDA